MLEKHGVKIQQVTTKYKHTHTAFVEALNKILAERLFKVQDAQELNDPEKVSSRWVKHLYGLVDELNDTTTEIIGMKPKDAIVLDEVPLVNQEVYPVLSYSQLIRYARCCSHYDDFRYRHKCLVDRLLSQGYKALRLEKSFKKFYGRYLDLIEKYRRSVNAMVSDSFPGQFIFNM